MVGKSRRMATEDQTMRHGLLVYDWTGANAVREDWVLLEGRACEIAGAEAHSNLQKAREKGTVSAYLQSLKRRGHVGLAKGLTILAHGSTSM